MKRAAAPAPELPGYSFVKVLGAGGFSDVYLYDQTLPRRQVAVKVLLGEAETAAERRQFADEANLMAALSTHPSIVTIYHADVAGDGRPYFVMEYCSGPNLSVRYKAQRLSVEESLRVGVKIASAVATAHDAGIMHRDIKPANILTNDFGGPALTDFGISSAESDLGHTTTVAHLAADGATGGSTIGLSVPWSPPEMFTEDPNPDVRADIFSLGATIYTLLAGRTPFERPGSSNSQLDLAGRIQRGDVTPIGRDDVPQSLLGVLEKAMAPRREQRYGRMIDLARAFQSIELELGYAPTPLELPRMRGADAVQTVDDPDAGETRVSTVRDVVAQPPTARPQYAAPTASSPAPVVTVPLPAPAAVVAPPVVAPPVGAPVADPVESTIIRPGAAPAPDTASPPTAPVRRSSARTRVLAIALGAIGLLAVAAIVVGILFSTGAPPDGGPEQTPQAEPQDPLGDLPPVPTDLAVTAQPDGAATDIQASWVAGDAAEGDSFYIVLLRGTQVVADAATEETSHVFQDQADAAGLCVEVYAARNGARSVDAVQECLS